MLSSSLSVSPPSTFQLLIISVCLKLLLFPLPASTDLTVHHHWKVLTRHLPLSEWYTSTITPWTLDYPPAFAFFEYILSFPISLLHPLTYPPSPSTPEALKDLLRVSVLLTDPLLAFSLHRISRSLSLTPTATSQLVSSILFSPLLVCIDSIHFQYNGLILSFLFFSLSDFLQHKLLRASFLFSFTLSLKHTLLPLAPPIAFHILHSLHATCQTPRHFLLRLAQIAICTLLPFLLYFPFPIHPLRHRLFPFHRGLLHIVWAPNFWALYAFLDKLLPHLGFSPSHIPVNPSSGQIGITNPFAVLPNPTPLHCALLIMLPMLPFLFTPRLRHPQFLLRALIFAGLFAVFFGWHVHEKAFLTPLALLAPLPYLQDSWVNPFAWISVSSALGVWGILHGHALDFLKILWLFTYVAAGTEQGWSWMVGVYAIGGAVIEVGGKLLPGDKWQFLPLMALSVYAAIGVNVGIVLALKQLFNEIRNRNNEEFKDKIS